MHYFKLNAYTALLTLVTTATALDVHDNAVPHSNGDVQKLTESLSKCAEIYFPGSTGFQNLTARWSVFDAPKANMVVVPCTEEDVIQIVNYANTKDMPFLAVNTAHGSLTTLGKMQSGIQISMEKLNSIKIAHDGKSVTLGGGVGSKDVIDALWEAGKQTVTASCECVSYMGPALGGGHGLHQGYYGLISDQFLSLNMVFADGTLKTIDSKDDLFWGMGGAGHNFGMVTSVTSRIYDIKSRNWALTALTFKSDKLEVVYEAFNTHFMNGNQSEGVVQWTSWANNATIDPHNPLILVALMQEGVESVASTWQKPLLDLRPIGSIEFSGTYLDLATWLNNAESSINCQKDEFSHPQFPLYLKQYDIPALKEAFCIFAENTRGESPFSNSVCLLEGYPEHAVQARPLDASAFAFRDSNLLVAMALVYKPGPHELDQKAFEVGERFRAVLQKGSGYKIRRVYVNYADGDEPPEEYYGAEVWRQKRLGSLKHKYDPEGKFSFFGVIRE